MRCSNEEALSTYVAPGAVSRRHQLLLLLCGLLQSAHAMTEFTGPRRAKWLPVSPGRMVVAAAAGRSSAVSIAPQQGIRTEGPCFAPPGYSCTSAFTAAPATRPTTEALDGMARRFPVSAYSRRSPSSISTLWVKRRVSKARAGRLLGGEAGAGVGGLTTASSLSNGGGGDGGAIEDEERKQKLDDLDHR